MNSTCLRESIRMIGLKIKEGDPQKGSKAQGLIAAAEMALERGDNASAWRSVKEAAAVLELGKKT